MPTRIRGCVLAGDVAETANNLLLSDTQKLTPERTPILDSSSFGVWKYVVHSAFVNVLLAVILLAVLESNCKWRACAILVTTSLQDIG